MPLPRPSLRFARRGRVARCAFAAFLLAIASAPPAAVAADSVLLIGNSFQRGLRRELTLLTRSALRDTVVKARAGNGWTFELHSTAASTAKALDSYPWTTVVMQEQSDGLDETRYPFARALDAKVAATGARGVFFLTWADRDDEPDVWDTLRGVPGGVEGYVPIALELDRALAPVGWAFREAILEDPSYGLWADDGHHASRRGQYLAALVLYATIYRESPVGLAPSRKLTAEQSLHDQLLAELVVFDDPQAWNLDAP